MNKSAPLPLRLTIVTDAWTPQVNGVVTTMRNTSEMLAYMGHEVTMVTPERFRSVPCPGYREIRLSVLREKKWLRRWSLQGPMPFISLPRVRWAWLRAPGV